MSRAGLNTISIDDPTDDRVAPYMNLKDAHLAVIAGHEPAERARGLFIAEGVLVVGIAINSPYQVQSMLVTPRRLETIKALDRLSPQVPVYVASRAVIERIVGFDLHRGVLAACERGPGLEAPDVIKSSRALVLLEDLSNHDNLGGLFRSVAALGGDRVGVLLSPRCCDPLYRKAIRVSMGHVLRTAFSTLEPWEAGLDRVREAGFSLVALSTDKEATNIRDLRVERPALVLGAEGEGLSQATLARTDVRARIPMAPGVDSLNVMAAGAIAMSRLITPV